MIKSASITPETTETVIHSYRVLQNQAYFKICSRQDLLTPRFFCTSNKSSSLEKLWAKRRPWLKSYEKMLKKLWIEQYQNKSPDNSRPASQDIDDIFQQHLCLDPMQDRRLQEDGYETYCTSRAGQTPGGLIHWWISQEDPDLAQWALNMHSIPAMSAECERVFSLTKLLITPRRNRLLGDFVEANECLGAWKKAGLI